MDIDLLHQILTAGYIRGVCNSTVLSYVGRDLHSQFVSIDNTVLGTVVAEKFNDGNSFFGIDPVGIPRVDDLLKMLKTLGKDVKMTVAKEGRSSMYLKLDDSTFQMKYGLTFGSNLQRIPGLNPSALSKNPPEMSIDKEFIMKFYKLSGAIKDCKYVYVNIEGGTINFILSQSDDYNTGAKLSYPITTTEQVPLMKFNVKKIRTLLHNNRDSGDGKIRFHLNGAIDMSFNPNNLKLNYTIIAE